MSANLVIHGRIACALRSKIYFTVYYSLLYQAGVPLHSFHLCFFNSPRTVEEERGKSLANSVRNLYVVREKKNDISKGPFRSLYFGGIEIYLMD